jgi:hypothetical protein
MRVQRYVVGGLFFASGVAAVQGIPIGIAGCNEPEPTLYGNPNTLDPKQLPGDGGVEPLICGAGDGGAEGGGGGGDAGCPSFTNDIFPLISNAGPWKCSDAKCHATVQQPIIKIGSAQECYQSLQQIKVLGRAYVDPNARDPTATTFLCNLQGTCGFPMPKPPTGQVPTQVDLCKVDAWIRCGSPL